MKKKLLALLWMVGAATSAHAQFGGLAGLVGGGSAGGGDVGALVASFNTDAAEINGAMAAAVTQIIAALGDKNQIAAVKEDYEKTTAATDAKEKGALQGTLIKNQVAVAQELLKADDAKKKVDALAPEMRKKVGQSLLAVGIAALRMPIMIKKGQSIVQGVASNPIALPKVLPVKDGLALFADVLPKLPTLVSTGYQLMKSVKVDPGNPTADAKPQAVDVSFP